MLQLYIEGDDFFNEDTNEFISVKSRTIVLEHSLLSISKWEAKWKKPFLSNNHDKVDKTYEEFLDYIRCMTITTNVDPLLYKCLTQSHVNTIKEYITDSMTATTINHYKKSPISRRGVTSELIYYWMTASNIPIECEKWHLNRLLTLIEICSIENDPKKKKMSTYETARQNAALNAARRAKMHSKG